MSDSNLHQNTSEDQGVPSGAPATTGTAPAPENVPGEGEHKSKTFTRRSVLAMAGCGVAGLVVGGVLAIAAAAGLLSGWAVSALVVGPLAWSSAGAELATPLRPALPPLLALLLAGAVAVALIVAWLARTVRAQALDAEYREEVR